MVVATMTACGSKSTGSPVLIGARWKLPDRTLETLNVADLVVPPGAQRFELVFDRRLDGDKIENGSGSIPQPRANPPVHLSFPGAPSGYGLTVVYASNATGGPAIWVTPGGEAAFPSAKTLTFSLDRGNITSTDGTPFTGPSALTVSTAPFSVDILVPPLGAALPRSVIPLSFNNAPLATSVAPHVRVEDGAGNEVPVFVVVDNRNRQLWNVEPLCAGGWPLARALTLVVTTEVTDLYGAALGSEARATFSVPGDGGATSTCVGIDAGAGDASGDSAPPMGDDAGSEVVGPGSDSGASRDAGDLVDDGG